MIARPHEHFSIIEQCALLKMPRSTLYYKPEPVSDEELKLMRRIDEIFTKWPFYGSRRMVAELRGEGFAVNRKRVRRLMRVMGIEAIYQKPNTSRKHPSHKIYPYLLEESDDRPPQSGMVRGHHVYPDGERLGVSGGRHGLVQPSCLGLAIVDHNGNGFLRRGVARGDGTSTASPKYSTRIRAYSLRRRHSSKHWRHTVCRSAWTVKAVSSTTSLSSACGAV